jgi:hypothetical protein
LGLVELVDTEDILEEDILDAGTNDFAVEFRLLLAIGAGLELLELLDGGEVGNDGVNGDKLLLAIGLELELLEGPAELVNTGYNGVEGG